MPTTASKKSKPRVNPEEELSPLLVWGGGSALVLLVAGLFWGVWKSQFAAPSAHLFNTPTQEVEAGYCLTVAQSIVSSGAPPGSYFEEAAQFWVKRLRDIEADMGPAIAKGRAKLSVDKQGSGQKSSVWLQYAMDLCSQKAVTYGARFRSFD
ncbi:hypothetical protein H9N28_12720 [Rhodobacter capsulatus]|uniref:hypothetical protein n=1 Tax=Rhodobacter capsulatus TaxID=1061 RepID=UPI0006DCB64B|nr:hypothetical protein [Rhodobacter capsulatus]KQB15120.1 hypothetical protein AP071_14710 [Rhodobacter capsulatus]KQB16839.1 hypothetical protein AP073_09425 [Rhodobacter capsulatus]PZX23625.1 hypothetical protein LY44_02249 [Rhodobacter capsulatus]QNR62421.1 hypothetical protein H9N28_12720 [Rhodobacter capsulatus]